MRMLSQSMNFYRNTLSGTAWGYVFATATLDFTGKFTGCTLSSKALGFTWREAAAVGSLMSCKGYVSMLERSLIHILSSRRLVELIVLNVGLSAGILTREVFSMFVLESLILTFMTTPLVNLIYPPKYRTFGLGNISRAGSSDTLEEKYVGRGSKRAEDEPLRHRFVVVLDEFKHMPGIMALTKLVLPHTSEDPASRLTKSSKASVHALRLIEFSERTSSAMKFAMSDMLIKTDPLVNVFKMFGEQSNISISASLSVVPPNDWAHSVTEHAERLGSQFVLIPWIPPSSGSTTDSSESGAKPELNPFDTFFGLSSKDNSTSTLYSHFVRGVFRYAKTDVALFVDLGDNAGTNGEQHILFPFFHGPDDRLALELVVQLCMNPRMSATVIRVGKRTEQQVIARPELAVIDEKAELKTELGVPITSVCIPLFSLKH